MWIYNIWKGNKRWKVKNCYELEDCINWGKWHLKVGYKPNKKKLIGLKWIYIKKKNAKEMERYKTRSVTKIYNQKRGIDYDEVFVSVARLEVIWLIITTAA